MKIGDRVLVNKGAYKGRLGWLHWISAFNSRCFVVLDGCSLIEFWREDIEPGLLDELARV